MGVSNSAKNIMLDAIAAVAVWMSLHTGDPGTTGASEVSGGSPAYARKAGTWNTAASGNLDNSNTPTFDIPAGTTVSHWGAFSASTAGTFYFGGALSASEAFTGQGTYQLTDADLTM